MPSTIVSEVGRKCLHLHLTPHLGPRRFSQLLECCGSVDAMLGVSAGTLASLDGIGRITADRIARGREKVEVDAEVDRAARLGVRILCRFDETYPPLLRYTADPPVCLFVKGDLQRTDGNALAIVGSRRCSHYGQEQARRFACLLAEVGLTITSGLARGIDGCAHHGALDGAGRTVAVLGCGLAQTYPPEHAALASKIVEHGALISELALDVPPNRENFHARNRIIAGMSMGTLMIEGTESSGAMITARHALDYNREVFALPGRVDSPFAAGPHQLIAQQQAKLITCRDDILDELGDAGRLLLGRPESDGRETSLFDAASPPLDETEQAIFDALDLEPTHMDEIVDRAGLPPARVAGAAIHLQLKGVIKQLPGGFYVKNTRQK